jgi:hypothetical protein
MPLETRGGDVERKRVVKITVQRGEDRSPVRGRAKRAFVLVEPPYCEEGDELRLDGDIWTCLKTEETEVLHVQTFPRLSLINGKETSV